MQHMFPLCVGLLVLVVVPRAVISDAAPPNVVLMVADDLGYGDLGITGHPTSRTPFIDNLGINGRFLTHFYVSSPICSPSRSSIMTGRYPIRTGIYPNVFGPASILGLPKNETTIAQLLKQKNYRALITGKWHLGVGKQGEFLPTEFGFDEFLGMPYSQDSCPCTGLSCFPNNGQCAECHKSSASPCPLFSNKTIVEQPLYLPTLTQRYADHAKKFIARSHADGKPFFVYMPFDHVHIPQFAGKNFHETSPRGQIGDALSELDWAVGQVLKTIKDLGLDNNTIVWFTSDNGPSLEHHQHGGSAGLFRCGKGTTMEGGVRVPSIVYWPGKIKPGHSNALTSTMDILPTLAAITGVSTSNLTLDGLDITDVLLDPEIPGPHDFLAQYPRAPEQSQGPFAVHHGRYKAHFWTQGDVLSDNDNYDPICRESHNLTWHDPPLLFDLYQDPGERYNLAGIEEYKDELSAIVAWRSKHISEVTWIPPRTKIVDHAFMPCCKPGCEPYPSCCTCNNHLDFRTSHMLQ